MGFSLLPLVVLTLFVSVFAIERNRAQDTMPPAVAIQAVQSGQMFVAYRNAVAAYQNSNPSFTGTVSAAALLAQGNQFSAAFLASAGNAITATAGGGRVITCFASLPTGSINAALDAAQNDPSLGMAWGANWTSYAPGASYTPTPLATSVPNGAVVSVVQIGN